MFQRMDPRCSKTHVRLAWFFCIWFAALLDILELLHEIQDFERGSYRGVVASLT